MSHVMCGHRTGRRDSVDTVDAVVDDGPQQFSVGGQWRG